MCCVINVLFTDIHLCVSVYFVFFTLDMFSNSECSENRSRLSPDISPRKFELRWFFSYVGREHSRLSVLQSRIINALARRTDTLVEFCFFFFFEDLIFYFSLFNEQNISFLNLFFNFQQKTH